MENPEGQGQGAVTVAFLQKCIAIEETVAEIYRLFLKQVPADGTLRKIWGRMAAEEDEHAAQIRLALRLPIGETFRGQKISVSHLEQLLKRVQVISQGVQASSMSVEDALRIGIKLERDFLDVHVTSAAEFADAKIKNIFLSLGREDEKHKADLEHYYQNFFASKRSAGQSPVVGA